MDDDIIRTARPASAGGGTVEPTDRAAIAKARFQTPTEVPAERYELRDPFAEVTYRASNFPDIAAKAEQLGSSRVVAVAEDGKRTPMHKVGGEWHRGPQLDPLPERPIDSRGIQDDIFESTPKPAAAEPTRSTVPEAASTASPQAVAKMDAAAEREATVARLEAALRERYVVKRAPIALGEHRIGLTEYRFRGDTTRVAFTESPFRLATDTNSPSVARSMVDVVESRSWKGLRVSGHEEFKRLVWLEASVRGVKALGYEPNPEDLDLLRREREARQVNRIEPAREANTATASATAEKASGRGGGRKAVLAAIEAVLIAKNVPEKQRAAVMVAATEKLAQRIRDGQVPKVKMYDRSAPSQRAPVPALPEQQRTRERPTPTHSR